MNLESEKYGELLQAIAALIAAKNIKIEELHDEITELKKMLNEAEQEKGI